MSNPVRFALIGTGNSAGFHADAIQQVPDAKLVAAFSRSNPGPFAEKHGCAAVTSLDDFARACGCGRRLPHTRVGARRSCVAAMRAGKHVLCEKPSEITPARVDSIARLFARNGASRRRFPKSLRPGRADRETRGGSGRFGRITLASAYINGGARRNTIDSGAWRGTWELDGGGALMNQGIHAIDLLHGSSACRGVKATTACSRTKASPWKIPRSLPCATRAARSGSRGRDERFPPDGISASRSARQRLLILEDDTISSGNSRRDGEDEAIRKGSGGGANIGGGVANPMA